MRKTVFLVYVVVFWAAGWEVSRWRPDHGSGVGTPSGKAPRVLATIRCPESAAVLHIYVPTVLTVLFNMELWFSAN